MTSTESPPPPPVDQPPPSTDQPPPSYRGLYRDPNGPVAGVATGLANHLTIDPIITQIGFVIATIFGGSGILVYLAAWFLVPQLPTTGAPSQAQSDARSRPGVAAVVAGTILLVVAVGLLIEGLGFGFGEEQFLSLLVLGAGVYLLTQRPDQVSAIADRVEHGIRPTQPWAVPQTATSVAPAPPKQAGPPITSISLALAAVAVGLLVALNELTGLTVNPEAIFGSVVAICGGGLLVASVSGRAWGLIPVGLLATFGIGLSQINHDDFEASFGERDIEISSEDEIELDYDFAAGELRLDLEGVTLTRDHEIDVDLVAGSIVIEVPRDMAVNIFAESDFGEVKVFGRQQSGTSVSIDRTYRPENASDNPPVLSIYADTTFGEVQVNHVD